MIFTPIQIELDRNGRSGRLILPLEIVLSSGQTIIVPAGFVTDFASVPRLLWRVLPPWGPYAHAAIVHDYLYMTGEVSRELADAIFLEIMEQLDVNWVLRTVMYRGVRLGGWAVWNRYRR